MVRLRHQEPSRTQRTEPGGGGPAGAPRRGRLLCSEGAGRPGGGTGREPAAQTGLVERVEEETYVLRASAHL